MAIWGLLAGVGASLLGGLLGADREKRIQKQYDSLKSEIKDLYKQGVDEVKNIYSNALTNFYNNLNNYKAVLQQQFPQLRAQIEEIFSEKNPQIANYLEALRKSFDRDVDRIYNYLKRAKRKDIRKFAQMLGSSIGGRAEATLRQAEYERQKQLEDLLTQKRQAMLQPQFQLAQQSAGAQTQFLGQNVAEQNALARLGLTAPLQTQTSQANVLANLYGRLPSTLSNIGITSVSQQNKGNNLSDLFTKAGSNFLTGWLTQTFGLGNNPK